MRPKGSESAEHGVEDHLESADNVNSSMVANVDEDAWMTREFNNNEKVNSKKGTGLQWDGDGLLYYNRG